MFHVEHLKVLVELFVFLFNKENNRREIVRCRNIIIVLVSL